MKNRFQLILSSTIFILVALGFSLFVYIVRKTTYNALINQTLHDNKIIGESVLQLLDKNPLLFNTDSFKLTKESDLVREVQGVCDVLKLPNSGYICAVDAEGNLLAAPGLALDKKVKIDVANFELISKQSNSLFYKNINREKRLPFGEFYLDSLFEGFYEYPEHDYSDLIVGLTHQSGLKLLVHQNHHSIEELAKKETRKLLVLGLTSAVLIAVIAFFIVNRQVLRYHEKIDRQQLELSEAFDKIKSKNKAINDSIRYAKDIQYAVLPAEGAFEELFTNHVLYYEPKEIVSGDFYWVYKKNDVIVLVLADCTGHGVPGALMAMIGNFLLEKTFWMEQIYNPAKALEYMHRELINLLNPKQTGSVEGMDMSVVCIDTIKQQFVFAGASQHLYFLRNGEVLRYKGDKKGLGGRHRRSKRFTNHTVGFEKGDWIYITTDGLIDQPNPLRKRFGSVRLQEVLLSLHDKSKDQQLLILKEALEDHAVSTPPRDDISIIGVEL